MHLFSATQRFCSLALTRTSHYRCTLSSSGSVQRSILHSTTKMHDCIDLTDDSPEPRARPNKRRKADTDADAATPAAAAAAVVVDLTDDNPAENDPTAANMDAAARRRIMAAAAAANASNSALQQYLKDGTLPPAANALASAAAGGRRGGAGGGSSSSAARGGGSSSDEAAAADDDAAAKARIMAFAAGVNARSAALRGGDGSSGPAYSSPATGNGGVGRSGSGDEVAGNSSNSLLAALHAERHARRGPPPHPAQQQQQQQQPQQASGAKSAAAAPGAAPGVAAAAAAAPAAGAAGAPDPGRFRLLTYNVWFEEGVALEDRMRGISDVVEESGRPLFICLQEMTPRIYELLSSRQWWRQYEASPVPERAAYFTTLLYKRNAGFVPRGSISEVPFGNSTMGRGLRAVRGTIGGRAIVVATSHLESPCGWQPHLKFNQQREAQAEAAMDMLNELPGIGNAVFAGDMNWNSDNGVVPFAQGWGDAWEAVNPGDPGWTYHGKANPMLTTYLKGRLDRCWYRCREFAPVSAMMVGTQPLRDAAGGAVTYRKETKKGLLTLPVLPSDHFGLLVEFEAR